MSDIRGKTRWLLGITQGCWQVLEGEKLNLTAVEFTSVVPEDELKRVEAERGRWRQEWVSNANRMDAKMERAEAEIARYREALENPNDDMIEAAALSWNQMKPGWGNETTTFIKLQRMNARAALEAAGRALVEGEESKVVHLPSGRKGTALRRGTLEDYVTVRWDSGYESRVDPDELRRMDGGGRL